MRYGVVAVVCLALGFGAGLLVFDWPFNGHGTDREQVVADQLLRDLRGAGASKADSAACGRQQASDNYACTVIFGLNGGTADDFTTYIVRPDGTYSPR
jgi:hypothetical protein